VGYGIEIRARRFKQAINLSESAKNASLQKRMILDVNYVFI
jgi:hypothetical protein